MDNFPEIPGYEIQKELGRGSIGTVYVALDQKSKDRVAMKMLRPELGQDRKYVNWFLKQSKNAAALNHPGLVKILEVGQLSEGDWVYTVMEWLPGKSLKERLEESPPDPERALKLMRQLGFTLDFVHRKKMTHLNLKPSNILFRDEGDRHPIITDMGLKKTIIGENALYSSPEENSDEIDGRSDIYSLGMILTHIATGSVPVNSDSPPILPEYQFMAPLIERMVETSPEQRMKDCGELIIEINKYLNTETIQAPVKEEVLPPEPEEMEIPSPEELQLEQPVPPAPVNGKSLLIDEMYRENNHKEEREKSGQKPLMITLAIVLVIMVAFFVYLMFWNN